MNRSPVALLASTCLVAGCACCPPVSPCGAVLPAFQLDWFIVDDPKPQQPDRQAMVLQLVNRGPVPAQLAELRINRPADGSPGTWLHTFVQTRALAVGEQLRLQAADLKQPDSSLSFEPCRVPVQATVWLSCQGRGAEVPVAVANPRPSALPVDWQHCAGGVQHKAVP